jgi:hypothetical protein
MIGVLHEMHGDKMYINNILQMINDILLHVMLSLTNKTIYNKHNLPQETLTLREK